MLNIEELNFRLNDLEAKLDDTGYSMSRIVQSQVAKKTKYLPQANTAIGVQLALCIDTIDPWKQNRVRYFHPMMHNPNTPINSLPWAWPVSVFGGFDDSGSNWVPPAGSTLCIMYENGNRHAAFYFGTTWVRDRGPDGKNNFNMSIPEYDKIHSGNRDGYLVGPDDGSQVFPPWNTESYNGNDLDSTIDFDDDPEALQKLTYPNIFGMKTNEKHGIKFVDGNPKCNYRWKRVEINSSCGNHMIFKDDHIHNSGQWAHPTCGGSGAPVDLCNDEDGNPLEQPMSIVHNNTDTCEGEMSDSEIIGGHPSTPDGTTYGLNSNTGTNPYFKHLNECRPIKGVGTPQNNKVALPQSGIQFLSISGHTIGMDDSVEEPKGIPVWKRSTEDFDFGCNDKFLGRMFWISATGHKITINDAEEDTGLRGEDNYIQLLTATGNRIELNDHTVGSPNQGCPPNTGGAKRGITLQSTSNHTIEMIDNLNEQCGETRKEGGTPNNKAKKAFIKIRTGYGLEMAFNDFAGGNATGETASGGGGAEGSQQETKNQNIQIFSPQKDNKDRGPHIMRFQEAPEGPGSVFLRVGGNYLIQTYDNHVTQVGEEDNPSDKLVNVSRNNLIKTEEIHFHKSKIHALQADDIILLMAGTDCQPTAATANSQFVTPDDDGCVPCVWPVLCVSPKGVTISDRVYVSASPDAECANILQMLPFHSCQEFEGCP